MNNPNPIYDAKFAEMARTLASVARDTDDKDDYEKFAVVDSLIFAAILTAARVMGVAPPFERVQKLYEMMRDRIAAFCLAQAMVDEIKKDASESDDDCGGFEFKVNPSDN